ncbi:hypothetical protein [Rhizobium leguminosarum]|uniref:hypothetical protein n=1 Tax=Rhizobium leguminosarum TaxID=384 RepID=UPI003F9E7539
MPDSASIGFKWEWNINTVAVLIGFIGGFVAWGYTLSEIKSGRDQNARDIQNLVTQYAGIETRLQLIERAEAKNDQLEYRLAQNEKSVENIDVRIGRVTESYSNQFADFRTQLSAISTQIALTNQTLQRIEARPPVVGRDP